MDSTIINISIGKKLLEEADQFAKKECRNRSELFREALRCYMVKQRDLEGIFEYGGDQARKQNIKKSDINRLIKECRDETKIGA